MNWLARLARLMDEVVVRQARIPADLEPILGLYTEQARWHAERWPEHFRAPESARVLSEDLIRLAREETACLLLATVGSRVVGLVCGYLAERRAQGLLRYEEPVAHVADLVVSRDVRGRGIGTTLMERIEQWAHDHGARTMTLQVYYGNEVARTLYERRGFQPVNLQMRKDLLTRNDGSHER